MDCPKSVHPIDLIVTGVVCDLLVCCTVRVSNTNEWMLQCTRKLEEN